MPRLILVILLSLGIGICHGAEKTTLEIIQLEHRSADEIIPLIQPHIEKHGGTVTGTGYKLILQGPGKDLAQWQKLAHEMDTPPQRLVITVRYTTQLAQRSQGGEVSGHGATAGDERIISTDKSAAATSQSHDDRKQSEAGVRVFHTQSREDDATDQQIQVLEGHWASFHISQRIPVVEEFIEVIGNEEKVLGTIKYKEITTGFAVRARLNDDQVTLAISPHKSKPDREQGGAINTHSATTTLSGQLGEWLDIGGNVSSITRNTSGVLHTTDHKADERQRILVKVEKAS